MNKTVDTIIYDCDGVLFDSEEAVLAYYDFICEKFNLPKIKRNNHQDVKNALMKTNEEIIRMLTNDESLIEKILEFAKNMNFKRFLHLMKPEKNLKETLDKLYNKGYNLAVFTNRGHSLHYLLTHFDLDKYFKIKITSFDVTNPKPDPEGLFKIINYLNTTNDKVLYIGDTTNDLYAAKNAKVNFISFKNKLEDFPVIYDHLEIFNFI
ncbi:HAD-superfamily hydrolase [Deferribacter desulfuricans SSM1]|uniref:phosphoglycolate phosphatase n=1 Tax=Deferribacter desulfuricans (strain DSM 14783 / JCM 11476 / NBRC 101012 / SSM1) TaxID=639282 RepID=D3PE07_DEFDS|nr:HAD family hydrolase [Deferribacter desulfuricans]BAI80830.1 HAD-superfamily hydrolase [Deferribacter desulfuricans SSM1]